MVSVKDLIAVTKIISEYRGISYDEAQQETIKIKNDEKLIRRILAGEKSFTGNSESVAKDFNTGEAVEVETVGEETNLPEDMTEIIEGYIETFRARDNIEDMTKITYLQWRAVCIYVGRAIKKTRVLEDIERERREGGKYFNPEAVVELLDIYEYICGRYSHAPNVGDFISFSGVSSSWFYDNEDKGLTSSRVEIRKKVLAVEARGQRARLTDGRGNPTSSIFYLKAKDGWREEATETHHTIEITTKNPLPSFVLPDISENAPLLPPV